MFSCFIIGVHKNEKRKDAGRQQTGRTRNKKGGGAVKQKVGKIARKAPHSYPALCPCSGFFGRVDPGAAAMLFQVAARFSAG
ncbi:hypothetical protein CAY53_00730 [Desulfobulbus oralis]|uniref:Uncharacterized protein n=1 Tax=Desulfobulbus oralis TaxID=1986146 RepID=A0A2L1GKI4_9BACT|nr:hypothetical protein CAY53_00730 [Desulfobulbus oralis]